MSATGSAALKGEMPSVACRPFRRRNIRMERIIRKAREAVRRTHIASGLSPAQASDLAARAAAQRGTKGLSESEPVPNIPIAIWRRRRN